MATRWLSSESVDAEDEEEYEPGPPDHVHIEIISDFSDPHCYVAKKKIDKAVREIKEVADGVTFHVTWEPLIRRMFKEEALPLNLQDMYENTRDAYDRIYGTPKKPGQEQEESSSSRP